MREVRSEMLQIFAGIPAFNIYIGNYMSCVSSLHLHTFNIYKTFMFNLNICRNMHLYTHEYINL